MFKTFASNAWNTLMAKGKGRVNSQPKVVALQRGLEILRCFDFGRQTLGASEIARLTGLPQPTVWRLCKTLEHDGYLVADDSNGTRFRPGLAVLTLGYAALGTSDLAQLAQPHLQAIADRFHGAAGLTTRNDLSMLFLQRCEGAGVFLTINLRVGSRILIANSGAGWAYLAGLSARAREALLGEIRIHNPAEWRKAEKHFRNAMEKYSSTGYIVNSGVYIEGLTAIAVPLGGPDPDHLYSLVCSVLGPTLKTEERRHDLGLALLDAARRLTPAVERSAKLAVGKPG
jgi:DNA-binding IclR family transcriptional regulator